jgi:ribose 5-phosphate isomerase B
MKKIIIASDHAGFKLKEEIKAYLGKKKYLLKDAGTYSKKSCDYPLFAAAVAKAVSAGKYARGILICKSGIGNSIVANRFPRVRAALCCSAKIARLSREHNDSNILVIGSGFVNLALARRITQVWLEAEFAGGRHRRRLDEITKIEKELGCRQR